MSLQRHPPGRDRRLARALLRPLPIPDHCRDLCSATPFTVGSDRAAHTVLFEFQLTAVIYVSGRTHGNASWCVIMKCW